MNIIKTQNNKLRKLHDHRSKSNFTLLCFDHPSIILTMFKVLNEPNVHGHVYRLFFDILGPYYLVLVLYVRSFGLWYWRLATTLLCFDHPSIILTCYASNQKILFLYFYLLYYILDYVNQVSTCSSCVYYDHLFILPHILRSLIASITYTLRVVTTRQQMTGTLTY
jgi:hypothetical protein